MSDLCGIGKKTTNKQNFTDYICAVEHQVNTVEKRAEDHNALDIFQHFKIKLTV